MRNAEIERHLEIVRDTPKRLAMALAGLPAALVTWTPAPGKWSILEIACHLRDMEREAYRDRYARILNEDEPYLPDVDGDLRALTGGYASERPGDVLEAWTALREESLALLSRVTDWSRAGQHETLGTLTLETLLRRHALGNDQAHLGQIHAIRERWKLLNRLEATPRRIADAIREVPDDVLRAEPAPGKWSIAANVCHLRDMERVFALRFSAIAFSEKPALFRIDNDRVARENGYAEACASGALAELSRLRAETLTLLRALPAPVWERSGVHPARGEVTIAKLAAHLADHDVAHCRRITELAGGYVAPEVARMCS